MKPAKTISVFGFMRHFPDERAAVAFVEKQMWGGHRFARIAAARRPKNDFFCGNKCIIPKMNKLPFFAAVLLLFLGGCAAPNAGQHYSGMETRPIKALSEKETAGYLSGKGMGMALAAELNGYPGPLHVLEFAGELKLSDARRAETEKLFLEMKTAAVALGKMIVGKEAELDALFSEQLADEKSLRAITAEIALLKGELRAGHLKYHLKIKSMLAPAEIARYNELRGYHGHHNHTAE